MAQKKFFNIEITGSGEIIGTNVIPGQTPKTTRTSSSELIDYLLKWGDKKEGIWYFRGTWMNMNHLRAFQDAGLIERMGTITELSSEKPFTLLRGGDRGAAFVYRVVDERINSLEPVKDEKWDLLYNQLYGVQQ